MGILNRPLKIVLDCGNAVPGPLALRTLERLGVDVIPIYCDWDNSFPNHPPDPTRQENMIDLGKTVIEHGAEFGIGMDGDGWRAGQAGQMATYQAAMCSHHCTRPHRRPSTRAERHLTPHRMAQ